MSASATSGQPAPPNYSNVTLMKAMGAKKYDPMPTDQHQWQRAEGGPMVHRIWSVLCSCSLQARLVGSRLVTTPYATEDDGVTPLTLVRLAKLLGEDDASNVRQAWKRGEEMGIWRRESGKLWLSGTVTEAQVTQANKKGKKVCTNSLTPLDLSKIKRWPQERQERFHRLWNEVHAYEQARIAEETGRVRDELAPVKDTIKTRFELDVRHPESTGGRRPANAPSWLSEFVQTGVHIPENGNVQTPATLVSSENIQSTNSASSESSGGPGPEPQKVADVLIPLPPDIAGAENPRRQHQEPSKSGGVQSTDHLLDSAVYAAHVRRHAMEAGIELKSRGPGALGLHPDERVIQNWQRDKVPLATIRHAIFLGALRQLVSAVNNNSAARINSLHYFDPIVREVQRAARMSDEYWLHIENRLKRERNKDSKTAGGGT